MRVVARSAGGAAKPDGLRQFLPLGQGESEGCGEGISGGGRVQHGNRRCRHMTRALLAVEPESPLFAEFDDGAGGTANQEFASRTLGGGDIVHGYSGELFGFGLIRADEIHCEQFAWQRRGGGGIQDRQDAMPACELGCCCDTFQRDFELQKYDASRGDDRFVLADICWRQASVGPGDNRNAILSTVLDTDHRHTAGARVHALLHMFDHDTVVTQRLDQRLGEGVIPNAPDQRDGRPSRAAATAWLAPLPPGICSSSPSGDGLAGAGQSSHAGHEIHVNRTQPPRRVRCCLPNFLILRTDSSLRVRFSGMI